MTQNFYGSKDGNPASLTRLIAFQTADGVPALDAALVPYKSYGGALTPKRTKIPRQSILQRPMRERKMLSKVETDGRTLNLGDLDPSNHGQLAMLLSLGQGYSISTADGHSRIRISQQLAVDGTAVTQKLTHVNDSNKGIPFRHVDMMVRSLSMTVQPKANASMIFGVEAGRFDFWGVPEVTGTGTVKPILRGTTMNADAGFIGNWEADATDKDVYIKVISDSSTEVVFQAKEASAGTYSSSQTATKGEWCYVYTGTSGNIALGGRAGQVEVYFPTGANNSFVDNDVWVFPKRRVITVDDTDYPTPRPIAETQFRFFLDGRSIYVDNGVTFAWDAPGTVTRFAAGGEQAIGTHRTGQQDVTVNVDRRLVDMDLQKAMMTADQVSLVIEAKNDTIVGTSIYQWSTIIVLPAIDFEGAMHDAEEGATNDNEVLTGIASKPASDFSYGGATDIGAECEVFVDTDLVAADLNL